MNDISLVGGADVGDGGGGLAARPYPAIVDDISLVGGADVGDGGGVLEVLPYLVSLA